MKTWQYYDPAFEYQEDFDDLKWPWAGHKHFIYDFIRNTKPNTIVELGTHKGTSFFSMCQAVKDAKLKTKLFAVDTWQGDEHAGYYGSEVYDFVNQTKNKYYSKQNIKLIKKTFDEAQKEFKLKNIDILHIDGLHTYQAVKHDFDNWIGKLKPNGVVILHDTHEKKDDFGVYKLWSELKKKHDHLDFYHSHGLGVLFLNGKDEIPKYLETIWQRYYDVKYQNMININTVNSLSKKLETQELINDQQKTDIANLNTQLNTIQSAKVYRLWQKYNAVKKLTKKVFQNPSLLIKAVKIILTQGPNGLLNKLRSQKMSLEYIKEFNTSYQLWLKKHYPTPEILQNQSIYSTQFIYQPLISIITPTFNTPIKFLIECIESVINQSYPNWELCIADDNSTDPQVRKVIKEYANKNKRIKYIFRKTNGHICAASNTAFSLATGQWIALLDHDDVLWPNALYEVVKLINKKPKTSFIYSDEDKLAEDGITHCDPFFKPDWSPHFLWSCNYITHFAVMRMQLVDRINGFRMGTEGAQDWDLFLRVITILDGYNQHPINPNCTIQHVSQILYSWRKSSNSTASEKHAALAKKYAYTSQLKVLGDFFVERGDTKIFFTNYLGYYQIYPELQKPPSSSIIIPIKSDKVDQQNLNEVIDNLRHQDCVNLTEIILVYSSKSQTINNNQTKDNQKLIKILVNQKPFNYLDYCLVGANYSHGEVLIFINEKIGLPKSTHWLKKLVGFAVLPEVGSVGPRILQKNGRIHSNGITVTSTARQKIKSFFGFYSNFNFGVYTVMIENIRDYLALSCDLLVIERIKWRMLFKQNKYEEKISDLSIGIKLGNLGLFNVLYPWIYATRRDETSDNCARNLNEHEQLLLENGFDDYFFNRNYTIADRQIYIK